MQDVKTWGKVAKAIGSGTADPVQSESAISPVPSIALANKPAPGQTGPKGLAPRTSYSKVNTGAPPVTGVGSQAKSQPPGGLQFLPRKTAQVNMTTMIGRPSLQEMMAAAMEGTMDKVAVAREASRQLLGQEKVAEALTPDHVPTEMVTKLANAMSYLGKLAEEGSVQMVGKGPNTLEISAATNTSPMPKPGQMGKGTEKHQPPMEPTLQGGSLVQSKKPNTALEDNKMTHLSGDVTISNETAAIQPPSKIPEATDMTAKNAMAQSNLERLSKVGSRQQVSNGVSITNLRKMAEDAINPAKVSGKGETPPPATATGEGLPAEPSDVSKQKAMIASSAAATDYTKGQAKKDPVSDVGQVVTEPAMKDPVLGQVLNQGNETSKMSMVKNAHQIAAARALLTKLAEEQKEKEEKAEDEGEEKDKKDKKKGGKPFPFAAQRVSKGEEKEKESQGLGMTTPAQFQGPSATPGGSMPGGM